MTVLRDGERVGYVTSAGWSYTLGCGVALAYVRRDLAVPGARLEVTALGERRPATVAREPPYDPEDARLIA
jgi:dimethylglycine dehydrogenase